MQNLKEIFRRNRTVILLFTMLVVVPSVFFGYLGFRAIRSDEVERQFQQRGRQQQTVRLFENELKNWLFSRRPDSAAAQALLRFTVDGDHIVIPDFSGRAPAAGRTNPVPGSSAANHPNSVPSAQEVEEIYYPRIQVFLRDFALNQNSGAQYFRRLKAMIVQIPGTSDGYVLESSTLMQFSSRKLDEITASEDFRGTLRIAEAGEPVLGGENVVGLNEFTFFSVAFQPKDAPGSELGRNILLYSTVLLTVITALGGLFLYRAVSYEMAVVQLRADLVSAVSHEFRTPVSSMLALLERLEAGHVVEKDMLQRYHRTLRQEARRLGSLVDKLLEFAQLEAGKTRLSFERVDLEEIVTEAANAIRQSNIAGHVYKETSSAGEPVFIAADRTAIASAWRSKTSWSSKDSTCGLRKTDSRDWNPF